jgi:hypothetical protein
MHAKPPWIDISHQDVSNSRWHTTWFLVIEYICPLKDNHVKLPRKDGKKLLQVGPCLQ